MKLEKAKQIIVYKSKRLFYAMCHSAGDETLNRIMEEEGLLQRKEAESKLRRPL